MNGEHDSVVNMRQEPGFPPPHTRGQALRVNDGRQGANRGEQILLAEGGQEVAAALADEILDTG